MQPSPLKATLFKFFKRLNVSGGIDMMLFPYAPKLSKFRQFLKNPLGMLVTWLSKMFKFFKFLPRLKDKAVIWLKPKWSIRRFLWKWPYFWLSIKYITVTKPSKINSFRKKIIEDESSGQFFHLTIFHFNWGKAHQAALKLQFFACF